MTEILSKCGYRCDLCPAYTANIRGAEDKQAVSAGWKRLFGFEVLPDEVECVGCHNKGQHADTGCPVRPCVIEKDIENCAFCGKFECESLKTRTGFLDDYLHNQNRMVTPEDYERYVRAYEGRQRLLNLREKGAVAK